MVQEVPYFLGMDGENLIVHYFMHGSQRGYLLCTIQFLGCTYTKYLQYLYTVMRCCIVALCFLQIVINYMF